MTKRDQRVFSGGQPPCSGRHVHRTRLSDEQPEHDEEVSEAELEEIAAPSNDED